VKPPSLYKLLKQKKIKTMETKLKIGDRVKITDSGRIYSTYEEMANLMGLTKWMPSYGATNDMTGVIVSIKNHISCGNVLAGVDLGDHEIIIDLEGLELLIDIPEKWCIQMTKENKDILYPWWKENIVGWNGCPILEGYTLLSTHPGDSSMYYCNDLDGFLGSHPEYTPITLEQFKTLLRTKPVDTNKRIKISRTLLNEYYEAATASQREFINDNFTIDGTTTVTSIIGLHNIACNEWKPIIKDNHPECFPVTKSSIELAVEKAGNPNFSGCNVKIEDDLILVELPTANKEWSFVAFKWVIKFCKENPTSYPVHREGHNNADYLYIQWND
jgi:hypothetical protein